MSEAQGIQQFIERQFIEREGLEAEADSAVSNPSMDDMPYGSKQVRS